LHLDLSPDVPWVHVDPLQLEQILINLAINARDAMPHGGCITFRTHPAHEETGAASCQGPGPYAAIAVIDQGTGIPCEDQSRIFEPFFTTKEVGRGTGLGLAVVHGIVTQAGGVVHLDSQVNRGTELRILLPAVPAPTTEPVARTPGGLKTTGAGESVLVVDDEPVIGQIVKQTLEPLGYQVWVAESAQQARELIDQQNLTFDALITDLSMPHQRGDQLAEEFQQRFPDLKIVLMSGHQMNPSQPSRAFRNKLQFLAKPFSAAELARSLQRALLSEERSSV
jgi:CheY-like chemotaxis protein